MDEVLVCFSHGHFLQEWILQEPRKWKVDVSHIQRRPRVQPLSAGEILLHYCQHKVNWCRPDVRVDVSRRKSRRGHIFKGKVWTPFLSQCSLHVGAFKELFTAFKQNVFERCDCTRSTPYSLNSMSIAWSALSAYLSAQLWNISAWAWALAQGQLYLL